MKKAIFMMSTLILSGCSFAQKERPILEYSFPNCSQSTLNDKPLTKICATRDFIALEPRKREKDWLSFLAAEGSSGYKGSIDTIGGVLEFQNQELNMKSHVWDFSKQGIPSVVLRGHNSIIKNGVILNANISLGGGYSTPNFSTNMQNLNFIYDNQFLYAKENDGKPIKNMFISNFNNQANSFRLSSWGGGIEKSKLIINEGINVDGSKATILNNQIISKAELGINTVHSKDKSGSNKRIYSLSKKHISSFIDSSTQIFPDANDDNTAIPSVLYVKFSPETVIDGNTFTLTHPNPNAYAIVLDHSPRVRITNNTFNGFKVPILMDQWSSIVDEYGNELTAEQFNNQGNILNPNQFAGDVTMNRKGEIVKK